MTPLGPNGRCVGTERRLPILGSVTPPQAPPPSTGRRLPRAAAFFDLDKTVIAKSSTLAYAKPFYRGGLINRRAMLRSGYAQFVFLADGADHDQMERMRAYLSAMCTGWDVDRVREIVAETIHDLIDPMVYDEAVELIDEHHAAGRDVVIVSSSGAEVVEPIGEMLGADQVVATLMDIVDGRYTGEIASYVYGPAKAEAIKQLATSEGYDLAKSFAYSDSVTDVPMLESVGNPCAVNPDRALRRIAVERGWPVLDFHQPVSLHSRFSDLRSARPAIAAAAVGAGAAAAGLVWYAARRRTPRAG
jgi:HAD superfamily hydrolase (TIGR01490 family)